MIAKEYNGGKIVAIASEDVTNWYINNADNRLLANNILGWLARPAYSNVLWLAVNPNSGTVPGHSSLSVAVTFNAAALSAGVYEARLAIEHNDPIQPFPVEVPVTLTVHPPTAVVLTNLTTTELPVTMPAFPLPLGAMPIAAIVALTLATWRSRRR